MRALQRKSLGWLAASLAGLALVSLSPAVSDARTKTKVKSALAATSVDPDASGQAGLALHGSDGKLDLKASHLSRNASFDVIVNGVKVGTLQTTRGGGGRQRFRSDPGRRDLILGFDPRGAQLSVRNGAGRDVLVGTMPAAADPNAIACCVTAADGTSACQEGTLDDCTAAAGVPNAAATCLPDPCEATPPPPPAAVVCCINETDDDESESECEDKTEADCAAVGGMTVQAESCEPNPCAPVAPPAGDVVACCLTHEHETECEVRTGEACTARGGTVMAGSTCDPNPCGAGAGSGDDGDGGEDDGGGGGGGEHNGGDD
jgi:hypothetical protein